VGKAAEAYRTLLAHNPKDELAMIKLARLYAGRLNNPRQALELAQSAHTLAPDDPQASALFGELVYRTGEYSWALSLLEQADHQLPNQPSVLYHLALACYSAGQAARADTNMQQAVAMGAALPELDQAKQFLALRAAAETPAKAQAAAALAQTVLEKDPNNLPALMVSALAQEGQGAYTEAEKICQKALAFDPVFAPAMRELAILYSRHGGDQAKAYALAEKALASMPEDVELGKTLGILACRQGDYDRSLRLLRRIAPQLGNDGESLCYLGLDYYHLNQRPESKETLQRALTLTNVPSSLAGEARRVLAELK
jgi:tetratricopeptide (TPR) repeat protein